MVDQFWARVMQRLPYHYNDEKDLAKAIGKPPGTLNGWKNKGRLPNAYYAYKIAEALKTTVEYLITGDDNQELLRLDPTMKKVCDYFRDLPPDDRLVMLGQVKHIIAQESAKGGPRTTHRSIRSLR